MNKNELQQGIAMILDLELNNLMLYNAINSLKKSISELGIKRNITAPRMSENPTSYFEHLATSVSVLGIGGAVVAWIYGLFIEKGFIGKTLDAVGDGLKGGFYGIGAGIVISIVTYIVASSKEKSRIEIKFNNDTKEYEQKIAVEKNRISKELRQKSQLQSQLNILIERQNNTKDLCSQCYKKMNIDSNFANLKSICYMNELLSLNITDHFDGVDGLYYLVKNEMRMEKLQSSIDDVSRKLDYAINAMEHYKSYLLSMNDKCDRMVSSVVKMVAQNNQIAENTAITAYNTERIAKEGECILFLEALSL